MCQVACRLLYQKFLCFKYTKRTYVKPYEVWGAPKSRGGLSTFSKIPSLMKSLKNFATDCSTARTSSVSWQGLDFLVKAFFSAEFSIYMYCLSTNLSLTECSWLKFPSVATKLHEELLKFWWKWAKLSFFIPECCGCWRHMSDWIQTILLSPELLSWRKQGTWCTQPTLTLAPAQTFCIRL